MTTPLGLPSVLQKMRRLSLRQLVYFVELKRHGGFGRAARALSVSQPTLSQQIAQLEETLGVTLIERGTRLLRLTDHGELLAGRAISLLKQLGETIALFERPAAGREIRIGIPSYASYPPVASLLSSFRQQNEDAKLFPTEMVAEEMCDALNSGELDAGFLSVPTPGRLRDDLDHVLVWQTPYLICLPKHHPLAKLPFLKAGDVAKLDIVLAPRDYHRAHYDHQLAGLRALGITPRIVHTDVATTQAQMALTSAGIGACLMFEGLQPVPNDLVLKPTDPPLCNHTLALFWSPENRNPLLKRFVSNARRKIAGV